MSEDGSRSTELDARLSRLEGLFERFVDEWRSERDDLRTGLNAIRDDIRKDTVRRSGVNWGAVGVLFTAIALASGLIGYIVNDVKSEVTAHTNLDGHTHALVADARAYEKIDATAAELTRVRDKVGRIEATRWDSTQGMDNRDRISRLETGMAKITTLIEETRAEQVRRTQRVYDEHQP